MRQEKHNIVDQPPVLLAAACEFDRESVVGRKLDGNVSFKTSSNGTPVKPTFTLLQLAFALSKVLNAEQENFLRCLPTFNQTPPLIF